MISSKRKYELSHFEKPLLKSYSPTLQAEQVLIIYYFLQNKQVYVYVYVVMNMSIDLHHAGTENIYQNLQYTGWMNK